jgi:heptosyltransferase-2
MIRVPNWVGDAVMAEPALRELRRIFRDAQITFVARPWVGELFDGENLYDDFVAVSEARGLLASGRRFIQEVRALREKDFAAAVLLTNSFATALSAHFAGVPDLAGYPTDGRGALLHTPIPFEQGYKTRHQVFYYLNIAAEVERRFKKDSQIDGQKAQPQLQATAEGVEKARHLFAEAGIVSRGQRSGFRGQRGTVDETLPVARSQKTSDSRKSTAEVLPATVSARKAAPFVQIQNPESRIQNPIVVLNPGATNSRAKQWLAEKFAATADLLAERDGFQSVIIGAPGDREVANRVAELMRTPVANLSGRTTIAELKGVLSLSSLVISNDTGAAHMSAALGVPTVVVFGPTEHFATRPFAPGAAVVRHDVECSPCMLKDCPIDHRCMTRVQVDDVYEAAHELLKD